MKIMKKEAKVLLIFLAVTLIPCFWLIVKVAVSENIRETIKEYGAYFPISVAYILFLFSIFLEYLANKHKHSRG